MGEKVLAYLYEFIGRQKALKMVYLSGNSGFINGGLKLKSKIDQIRKRGVKLYI